MIAFAVCIGSRETYERHCHPGVVAYADQGSPLAEIETDSIFSGYNEALDAFASYTNLEALVLLHEDVEIRDRDFGPKIRHRLTDPSIAVIGAIGARQVALRTLRFDDQHFHGFHGYDVDFCLQAGAHGRRVVVDDPLVHRHTRGGLGDGASFWEADQTLRCKWTELGREMADDDDMRADTRAFLVVER